MPGFQSDGPGALWWISRPFDSSPRMLAIPAFPVTRPLTLTVTHYKCGLNIAVFKQVCGADIEATLRRSDFGMTKFLPFVVDDVRLRIQVEALRDSAGN